MLATVSNVAVERDLIDAISVPNMPNCPALHAMQPASHYSVVTYDQEFLAGLEVNNLVVEV